MVSGAQDSVDGDPDEARSPVPRLGTRPAWLAAVVLSAGVVLVWSYYLVSAALEPRIPDDLDRFFGVVLTFFFCFIPVAFLIAAIVRVRWRELARPLGVCSVVVLVVLVGSFVMDVAMIPTRVRFATTGEEMERTAREVLALMETHSDSSSAGSSNFVLNPEVDPGYLPGERQLGWLTVYSTDVGACRNGYASPNSLDDFGVYFHLGPNPYAHDTLVYCPQADVDLLSALGEPSS